MVIKTREDLIRFTKNNGDVLTMDLEDADFSGFVSDGINFSESNLSRTKFNSVSLSQATFSFANMRGAQIRNSTLHQANLWCTDLNMANLENTKISKCYGERSDFTNANLQGVEILNANFWDAKFVGANLTNAVIKDSDLTACDFSGAIMDNATLINVKIKDVIGDGTLIRSTYFNQNKVILFEGTLWVANRPGSIEFWKHCNSDQLRALKVSNDLVRNWESYQPQILRWVKDERIRKCW